ncbi:MAG: peptidylprolyl isomerase [Gammaproteobacteria bacterium]|nr:peptidylprolyl isomerase [Gammaproteobacteria bacterium]MDG2338186.1 peptidylprolyl isomerase [Gammaproteobacteria bacterium]
MTVVSWRSLGRNLSYSSVRLVLCFVLVPVPSAMAGTIVRISTGIGDYSIELLDDVAPITVQNFLNYVNRNDYNGTYIHRAVDNFVVQGGGYRFRPFEGPIDVPSDAPIQNEFSVSNTRGTVAMAKVDGDPNSATNQWFVNLVDNSASLDDSNGGFTVFGVVLGDGMITVDAIDSLPFISLGVKASEAPYITPEYINPKDFLYINAEVMQRFSSAPHVLESATGLLITSVSIDSGADLISMNFNAVSSSPNVVIRANAESVIPRKESFDGIAEYSTIDGRLRIPSLEVNLNGSVSIVSNVVFVLTDLATGSFTLESFDQ